jgi:hypothetical protein
MIGMPRNTQLQVVLADKVFQRLLVTGFWGQGPMLAMRRDDVDLW